MVAFAFSQPIYALLTENPTFLVAHELVDERLVVFTLALTVVPSLVVAAMDELLGVVSPPVADRLRAGLRGVLLGLVVAPPINASARLDGLVAAAVLVLATAGGVLLFLRFETMTTLVRVASFAVPLFIGMFLWASPASGLLGNRDVESVSVTAVEETSVVWLVFDQLPLGMMIDEDGRIDAARFPNFARLAGTSTWYPRATTVSGSTTLAMPSTLSGRVADARGLPLASYYPVNLFTLLADSHEMHVFENVTQLCPPQVCGDPSAQRADVREADGTIRDTWIVLVRTILPDAMADVVVPEISGGWSGFGGRTRDARTSGDDRDRFDTFLEGIGSARGPALYYLHLEKPHEPLLFVPDGRIYDKCSCYEVDAEGRWPTEPAMTRQRLQRYLLQSMYVDQLLGQVLDRLEETGLGEEALLLVMSDHGVASLPGLVNKTLTETNLDAVLPIPLLLRYPGQTSSAVDTRTAQVTDLLPTVLDALEFEAEAGDWLSGSLLAPTTDVASRTTVITEDGTRALESAPAAENAGYVEWMQTLYPEPFDPYAQGPAASLVGQPPRNIGSSRLTVDLANSGAYRDVRLATEYVPAHLIGELHGADAPVELAVAANGTVAGVGTTFWNGRWQVSLMIDPRHLVGGANRIQFFEVTERGLLAIPIE